MRGWTLSFRLAPTAALSIIRAKPAVVNGEPRSLTKTKGDDGALPLEPSGRAASAARELNKGHKAALSVPWTSARAPIPRRYDLLQIFRMKRQYP
jgi:hypothetical protein